MKLLGRVKYNFSFFLVQHAEPVAKVIIVEIIAASAIGRGTLGQSSLEQEISVMQSLRQSNNFQQIQKNIAIIGKQKWIEAVEASVKNVKQQKVGDGDNRRFNRGSNRRSNFNKYHIP